MPLSSLRLQTEEKPVKGILAQFLLVALGSLILAQISSGLWVKYTGVIHTFLEVVCIFIAISTFLVVWHSYERNSAVNLLLGFGFLIVAVFDIFHTYYFPVFGLYPAGYFDLSTRYWVLGRLTEAIVLLTCTMKFFQKRKPHFTDNKWFGFLFSLSFSMGVSYLILYFPGLLPVLFTQQGLTPAKIIIELIIISLFGVGIFNLKNALGDRDMLTYRYIFLALLLAIPAELCFTLFDSVNSFYNCLGHIFIIAYNYYLYRGIFVSAITYPYEKLEEARKYTAEILNGLPVGLITYGTNLKVSFVNQKAQKILAYNAKKLHGLSTEQILEKFGGDRYPQIPFYKKIIRTLSPIRDEIATIRNSLGEYVKLMVNVQVLANQGLLYTFTEAKKEQKLEHLQLQTQTILNSINKLVVLVDASNKVIMCNRAFENALEMNAHEVIGRDMEEVYKLLQLNKQEMPPRAGQEGNEGKTYEVTFTNAAGRKKQLLLNSSPISNVDGEIIGGIIVASDITALKKEQQRLQQQEKLVVIGQMAAGIVHEIKNPLTTIKGFNQFILSKAKDEQIKRYANIIDSATDDVNKVVSDFLAFARPRPPVLNDVSVNDLIMSMKLMLESHNFINGVETQFVLAPEASRVMADEAQIKQVVLNIVKNAIDAMDESPNPQLRITTSLSDTMDEMLITISDNGKGISPEDKIKIGTPFFTTKEKGTGLGLSICFQIVKEHAGSIDIESEPGRGTSFIISLPCKTEKQIPVSLAKSEPLRAINESLPKIS